MALPAGPFGPPTAFSSLTVAGLPVPYASGGGALPLTTGNYWFVSSVVGSAGNDGKSPQSALAAVFGTGGAYGSTVTANGDVIVCMPGHVEPAIISATAAAMAKSGVQVVGLGWGALRPTFTLSTANTATIAVSADNQAFQNCIFVANFLSIASCFLLTTAKNFMLTNCLFLETSSVLDFLNIVKSTGAANTIDGITLINNQWCGKGTTSVNTFLLSANDIDRATLQYNIWQSPNVTDQAMGIVVTAGVLTNIDYGYNFAYRAATTSVQGTQINVGGTTSTGWVYNNYSQWLGSGDLIASATSGLSFFNNQTTDVVSSTSGFLRPAADT